MPTNYPYSVDVYVNPTAADTMDGAVGGASVDHDVQHSNHNDGILALENFVGFSASPNFAPNVFADVKSSQYGATGNGTTDDTAAIAAAVASGLPVFFPAGTYKITSTISLPSGTFIYGAGAGQIYNTTSNNAIIEPYACSAFTISQLNTQGVIQDIQINGTNAGAHPCINFTAQASSGQTEWSITRVFVQNATSTQGLYLGAEAGGVYVTQSTFYNNQTGIYLVGTDTEIDTCLLVDNTEYGVVINGAICTIRGCSIGGNGIDGVHVVIGTVGGALITNNAMNLSGQRGLYIGSQGVIVTSNNFHTNSQTTDNNYGDIEIANYGGDPPDISDNYFWVDAGATAKASYNVVFDGTQGAVGSGNVVNPQSNHRGFTNTPANFGFGNGGAAGGAPGLFGVAATLGDSGSVAPFTPIGGPAGTIGANSIEIDNNAAVVSVAIPQSVGTYYGLAHICYLTQGVRAGQLMAVFREGTAEGGNQGTIYMSFSSSGGANWTTAVQLISNGSYDCRGLAVAQLVDGRIVLTYTLNGITNENYAHPGSSNFIFCPTTADPNIAGNWTLPVAPFSGFSVGYDNCVAPLVDIGPQGAQAYPASTVVAAVQIPTAASVTNCTFSGASVTCAFGSNSYMVTGDTVVVAGITGFTTNNPNGTWTLSATASSGASVTFVVSPAPTGTYGSGGTVVSNDLAQQCQTGVALGTYSSAGGSITWGSFQPVAVAAGQQYQEPHFTITQSGRWIETVRNTTNGSCLIWSSDNQGSAWTQLTSLNYIYAAPRVTTLTDGTIVILSRMAAQQWSYQANSGNPALVYSTKASNGSAWSEPKIVEQRQGFTGYDYGGVAQTPNGVLAVVYSISGGGTYAEILCRFASKVGAATDGVGGQTVRGLKSIDGDVVVQGGTFVLNGGHIVPQVIDAGPQAWTGTLTGWPNTPRTVISSVENGGTNFPRSIQLPLNTGPNAVQSAVYFSPQAGTVGGSVGAQPFTVEFRCLKLRSGITEVVASKWNALATADENWQIQFNASNEVACFVRNSAGTSISITGGSAVTLGAWHNIAYQWDGSASVSAWVDGTSIGSAAVTALQVADTTYPFIIGGSMSGSATPGSFVNPYVGSVGELRISTVARYTAGVSYTPATTPFALDSNTQLLVHGEEIRLTL